jgi:hypothetical protein
MNRPFVMLSFAIAIALVAFAVCAPKVRAQCPPGSHECSADCGNVGSGHRGIFGRGILGGHGHGLGCGCCDCFGGDSTCCYCQCGDCGYMLPAKRARWYNWNRNYAHTEYGQPVALVVPPTANMQTNYGWGVASSRLSRIEHQFQRNFPGSGMFGGPFRPTPVWPSDTTQFGVYYVRAPW